MKDASGGGQVASAPPAPTPVGAPTPATAAQPAPGAQPAAPAAVTGGGAAVTGGGATCFAPPEPVQCGTYVPAPQPQGCGSAVAGTTGNGASTAPPEPISVPQPSPVPGAPTGSEAPKPASEAPGGTDTPGNTGATTTGSTTSPTATTVATTPASQLPTWGQWSSEFAKLGLPKADIDKIGAKQLTDEQLATVFVTIKQGLAGGATPSPDGTAAPSGTTAPGQPAWSPQWEKKFLALGLKPEEVAQLKTLAMEKGADDATLQQLYDQLAGELKGQQPGAADPSKQAAGWSPEWQARFKQLGMPDSVIALYAKSGAPASGLEAAYKHAAGRLKDFQDRGWYGKFVDAKLPPEQLWGMILADKPMDDKMLKTTHGMAISQSQGGISKLLNGKPLGMANLRIPGLLTLIPGGELAQWAAGRRLNGEQIDRFSPTNLLFAGLSGIALVAAVKGGRNIMKGFAAGGGGFAELAKAGGSPVTDAAMAGMQSWGAGQKLKAFIPFTDAHRLAVGAGHVEAGARAFNANAGTLLSKADGALQIASLRQMFNDIATGAVGIQGGKNAFLGNFKTGAAMTLGASKDGSREMISVAKGLGIGDGRSQMVGLSQVAGEKIFRNPTWLSETAPSLVDNIAALPNAHGPGLGRIMAGSVVSSVGVGNDGLRMSHALKGLGKVQLPEWYKGLAAGTAAEFGPGAKAIVDGLGAITPTAAGAVVAGGADEAAKAAEAAFKADQAAKLGLPENFGDGVLGGAVPTGPSSPWPRVAGGTGTAGTSTASHGAAGVSPAPAGFREHGGLLVPNSAFDGAGTVKAAPLPTRPFGVSDRAWAMQHGGSYVARDRSRDLVNVDEVIAASRRLDEVRTAAGAAS